MSNVIYLLPAQELAILQAYINGCVATPETEKICDELGVQRDASATRLQIASAQILLHDIQDDLPQWQAAEDVVGRMRHRRHAKGRQKFRPLFVCEINWADSAPGISWPEAYYITPVPVLDKYIITASRDGEDQWGCVDHAIGFQPTVKTPRNAALLALLDYWRMQAAEQSQERWAYLFSPGLIGSGEAEGLADLVWEPEVVESNDPLWEGEVGMDDPRYMSAAQNKIDAQLQRDRLRKLLIDDGA